MRRRNFIKISGVSVGSLLFTEWSFSPVPPKTLLQLPQKVFVTLDDGVHELLSGDKKLWKYNDVEVQVNDRKETYVITVQSPTVALHNIQLQWKFELAIASKILGDHWERTYGDTGFEQASFSKKMPWYLVIHDKKNTVCFGVKTGAATICSWQLGTGLLQLTMDTRSGGVGVQLGGRTLKAAEITATKNTANENTFATARRFCGMMCAQPRLPKLPVYGINDWYFAYGKNSSGLILQHTALLADLATNTSNRPFSVVDAGWAAYSPLLPDDCCWQDDFSKPNNNFKDMARLASDIEKLGMQPGLWTRPLCAMHTDASSLLLPTIPGRNNSKNPVLDPSIPENIERVKRNISIYRTWGYKMVKHDFSTYDILGKWGFEMQEDITTSGWRFHDNTKTTAEVISDLYREIRNAAGDLYLIGCNTVGHLSAGLFELNRIGDDTSGNEWERTRKMGVNTLGFRMVQHNKFFAADGDCVGLTNKVPWEKNKQWMQLLAESSSPLFISAQPDAVGKEQRDFIKKCFSDAAKIQPVAEPLDWLDNKWPTKWKLNNTVKEFDWS